MPTKNEYGAFPEILGFSISAWVMAIILIVVAFFVWVIWRVAFKQPDKKKS